MAAADPFEATGSCTFEVLNGMDHLIAASCRQLIGMVRAGVTQRWSVLEPPGPMEGAAMAVRDGQILVSGGFKRIELANWPTSRRVMAFNAQTGA